MRLDRARESSPRLGFFGVIDERFDAELLRSAAEARPDWMFEMVGPVVKIDPAGLPSLPNIIWAGPCPHEKLPERLAAWDVGIMPFAINEATRYISPTKTPEFLAAGLPVVSTPIVDVVRSYGDAGLVEIASNAESLIAAVESIRGRPREPWLDAVDKRLARNSWDATWERMHALARRARREIEPMTAHRGPSASVALAGTRAEHV
jgi:glycosyltransferase involved in cell wall biosynthesis